MLIRRVDLIKKGYEALQEAERAAMSLEYRDAEVQIGIANAAARLADVLGEKSFNVTTRQGMNW